MGRSKKIQIDPKPTPLEWRTFYEMAKDLPEAFHFAEYASRTVGPENFTERQREAIMPVLQAGKPQPAPDPEELKQRAAEAAMAKAKAVVAEHASRKNAAEMFKRKMASLTPAPQTAKWKETLERRYGAENINAPADLPPPPPSYPLPVMHPVDQGSVNQYGLMKAVNDINKGIDPTVESQAKALEERYAQAGHSVSSIARSQDQHTRLFGEMVKNGSKGMPGAYVGGQSSRGVIETLLKLTPYGAVGAIASKTVGAAYDALSTRFAAGAGILSGGLLSLPNMNTDQENMSSLVNIQQANDARARDLSQTAPTSVLHRGFGSNGLDPLSELLIHGLRESGKYDVKDMPFQRTTTHRNLREGGGDAETLDKFYGGKFVAAAKEKVEKLKGEMLAQARHTQNAVVIMPSVLDTLKG